MLAATEETRAHMTDAAMVDVKHVGVEEASTVNAIERRKEPVTGSDMMMQSRRRQERR